VKEWTLQEFLDMGQEQRTAIRKALNEDADKLLAEGDPSDPQLRRLKREINEVNLLFDDFEKRARIEEESRHAGCVFNEQISLLQESLDEAERILNVRITTPLPLDLDNLEHLVLEHKNYEQQLQRLTTDIDQLKQSFRNITIKTSQMKSKLDNIMSKWNHIWNQSSIYIEQLKCIDIILNRLEENSTAISEFEIKLASFDELPSEMKAFENILENLMLLQNAIAQQQILTDQLNDDTLNARRLVEKSRLNHRGPHGDIDRLDLEINKLNIRWTNICGQLVDRLRSAETAYGLSQQYRAAYQNEIHFIDESYKRYENISLVQNQAEELETKVSLKILYLIN
jgi:dystonin